MISSDYKLVIKISAISILVLMEGLSIVTATARGNLIDLTLQRHSSMPGLSGSISRVCFAGNPFAIGFVWKQDITSEIATQDEKTMILINQRIELFFLFFFHLFSNIFWHQQNILHLRRFLCQGPHPAPEMLGSPVKLSAQDDNWELESWLC